MENLKKLKFSIVALLLFGCAGSNTFIMKEVYTYPEERYVLEAVPVIPLSRVTVERIVGLPRESRISMALIDIIRSLIRTL